MLLALDLFQRRQPGVDLDLVEADMLALEPGITFSDDPLRMMRAARFATQLNLDIKPDTFDGLVQMAERISIISKERINDELNKIILAKTPSYGFKLLIKREF